VSGAPRPVLSVVIVNYNGARWLPPLLDSLQPQLIPYSAEVILADNASTDDSVSVVHDRYPRVVVVQSNTNKGYAAGANLGLTRARGEWIFVLNTDLQFPLGSVQTLVSAAQHRPHLGLAGPLLIDKSGKPVSSYGNEPTEWAMFTRMIMARDLEVRPEVDGPPVQTVPYLVGACLLVRRAALNQVGLMDERFFMYFEDVDWSRRFRAAGWEVALLRDARVIHFGGGTTQHAPVQPIRWFYISLAYFACKHYGRPRALAIRLLAIVTHILGLMYRWGLARLRGTQDEKAYRQGQAMHRAALRSLLVVARRQDWGQVEEAKDR